MLLPIRNCATGSTERRLKKIRKLFSKEFQTERDLSAICAAAWLLDHDTYFKERDDILVDEIKRVLDRRAIPLTSAELEMLGELGRKAVADKVSRLPMSQAVIQIREHLDLSEEALANALGISTAALEELESGTRRLTKEQLQVLLMLMRKTIHKLPELEIAIALAL
jgi:DNA-binding transcriptional regulator YiaG